MGLFQDYQEQRYEQIKSKGDGNCLFNSVAIWFILTSLKNQDFTQIRLANGSTQNWAIKSYQNLLIKETVKFFTRKLNLDGIDYIAIYKSILRNRTLLELQKFMSIILRDYACHSMRDVDLHPIFEDTLSEQLNTRILESVLKEKIQIQDDIFSPVKEISDYYAKAHKFFLSKLSGLAQDSAYKTLLRECSAIRAQIDAVRDQEFPAGRSAAEITLPAAHTALIPPLEERLNSKKQELKDCISKFIKEQLILISPNISRKFKLELFAHFRKHMSKNGVYAGDYELGILCRILGLNYGIKIGEHGRVMPQLPESRIHENLDVIFYHHGEMNRHWDAFIPITTLHFNAVQAICSKRPVPFNPRQLTAMKTSEQLTSIMDSLVVESSRIAPLYNIEENPVPTDLSFFLDEKLFSECVEFNRGLQKKLRDICSTGSFDELSAYDIEVIYFHLNIVSYLSALTLHGRANADNIVRIYKLLVEIHPSLATFYRDCKAPGVDKTLANVRHITLCYSLLIYTAAKLSLAHPEGTITEKSQGIVTFSIAGKILSINTGILEQLRPQIKIKQHVMMAMREAENSHTEVLDIKKHFHVLISDTITELGTLTDKNHQEIIFLNELRTESIRISQQIALIQDVKKIRSERYRSKYTERTQVTASSAASASSSSREITPAKDSPTESIKTKIGSPCYLRRNRQSKISFPTIRRATIIVDDDVSSIESSDSDSELAVGVNASITSLRSTSHRAAAAVSHSDSSTVSPVSVVAAASEVVSSHESSAFAALPALTEASIATAATAYIPAVIFRAPKPKPKQSCRIPSELPVQIVQKRKRALESVDKVAAVIKVNTGLGRVVTQNSAGEQTIEGEIAGSRQVSVVEAAEASCRTVTMQDATIVSQGSSMGAGPIATKDSVVSREFVSAIGGQNSSLNEAVPAELAEKRRRIACGA